MLESRVATWIYFAKRGKSPGLWRYWTFGWENDNGRPKGDNMNRFEAAT